MSDRESQDGGSAEHGAHVYQTYQFDCPHWGCPWRSREYANAREGLAAQVDAALHYVETHGGRIPEDAPFGDEQCPECFDIMGLNGTVSCSECGHIPEEVRA